VLCTVLASSICQLLGHSERPTPLTIRYVIWQFDLPPLRRTPPVWDRRCLWKWGKINYSLPVLAEQARICAAVHTTADDSLAAIDSSDELDEPLTKARGGAAECLAVCEEAHPRAQEIRAQLIYLCGDYPLQKQALRGSDSPKKADRSRGWNTGSCSGPRAGRAADNPARGTRCGHPTPKGARRSVPQRQVQHARVARQRSSASGHPPDSSASSSSRASAINCSSRLRDSVPES